MNPGSINPGSINPEYQSGVSIQGARRGCEHHSTGSTHGFPAMAVLFRRLSVLLLRVLAHVAPGVLKSDVLHLTVASEGELGVAIGLLFLLTRWFICLRVGSFAYALVQLIVGRMLVRLGTWVVVAVAAILVALG